MLILLTLSTRLKISTLLLLLTLFATTSLDSFLLTHLLYTRTRAKRQKQRS
jgi:hypothetical protein